MPNKSVTGALTARDLEVLALAWDCFEGNPKLNWQKLADLAAFKNVESARACFLPVKKKLANIAKGHAGDDGNAGEEARKPVTNSPQKRKQAGFTTSSPKKTRVAADSDDEDKDQVKRPKRKVATRRKVKVEKMDTDEEDEYLDGEA
ncbi:hypothetical protein GGR53DRAFT_405184 [Hypoxylon sp. FL1150]|nr:hypothetical protein GGR53DRAFT_405184 [Hypoxylon sp. FL1150]